MSFISLFDLCLSYDGTEFNCFWCLIFCIVFERRILHKFVHSFFSRFISVHSFFFVIFICVYFVPVIFWLLMCIVSFISGSQYRFFFSVRSSTTWCRILIWIDVVKVFESLWCYESFREQQGMIGITFSQKFKKRNILLTISQIEMIKLFKTANCFHDEHFALCMIRMKYSISWEVHPTNKLK